MIICEHLYLRDYQGTISGVKGRFWPLVQGRQISVNDGAMCARRMLGLGMARKDLTMEQAKALADKLDALGESIKESWELGARFSDAGPHRVIEMWETGRDQQVAPKR